MVCDWKVFVAVYAVYATFVIVGLLRYGRYGITNGRHVVVGLVVIKNFKNYYKVFNKYLFFCLEKKTNSDSPFFFSAENFYYELLNFIKFY